MTIDTTAPAEALSITAIATDSGTVGDFITSDTTLTVSGTNGALAAGEKIQISSNGGTTWTDVVQGTATAWSLVDPTTHATSFTYQARIIDAAANVGTTASQAVTIDTTAPAVSITGFTPDSGTIGDGITNATTVTVSGTAEIGSLVTLFDNLNSVGTVAADGSGQWSISESGLTNGSIHSFTATATDNAGNISSPTAPLSVTIITGGPAEALSITAIATDSGTVGDFITSDTTLTVSGTNGALAAGEKIQVSSDGGTTWTDVVQGTATTWSLVDPTTHATSFTYQARIIDAAANVGTTASQAVTIDTTAPAEALAITAIATDSGTVRRLHHQRHHADGLRHQWRARRRREDPGQQRRRHDLDRCGPERRDDLEPGRCDHARRELHLPGADHRCGGQCRHHRQPGGHHRHHGAGGSAGDHGDCRPTPARSATSSPATPR